MNTRRCLLNAFVAALILFLAGCGGKANPEYYKALNDVVTFMEALELPAADQVATDNIEFQKSLAEFTKLHDAVDKSIDAAASKTESYLAYERLGTDLLAFTQNYKKYYLSTTVNEEFDQKDVEKVVADGKKKMAENITALKAAIAKEKG